MPTDAWALVVLGPSKQIPKETFDALDRFMDRSKNMLVALDMVLSNDNKSLKKTGMESFLRKFGVDADDSFVLRAINPRIPDDIRMVHVTPPDKSNNLIAKQFNRLVFDFDTVRVVKPAEGATGRFKAETILQADPEALDMDFWIENNAEALKHRANFWLDNPQAIFQRFVKEPVPVAVAVTETEGAGKDETSRPRMVVFGDAEWVSNARLVNSRGNYSLFASSLEWMSDA